MKKLWDVFTDQEAVEFVKEFEAEHGKNAQELSGALLDAALERGSTDNISVMFIYL